ncbi:MAG: tRNA uridine-5-carboxymethylaminomethyl(34) synthesis GTPase MnmE [Pseudomonadales bacterium]|nr:tRNA uridine-5-carboxymethylaminomethyl(34) synthesis GTPase MnmE [Pseudomonadales bacterium]
MSGNNNIDSDTIAAIATAAGKGGIGIIRLSGPKALPIAKQLIQVDLAPRYALFTSFVDKHLKKIDEGIALYFPKPNSFTGEDVVELQGHGGSVILNLLLAETVKLGARIARPGEFSERAFLNDKIDLVQAEAIADIIESRSETAAKSAMRSLSGEFSKKISALIYDVTQLRVYVEAAIDFPEEEVDFVSDGFVLNALNKLNDSIEAIWKQAKQGSLLRDGVSVVIIGKPNAGKSSLLNLLAGDDLAIVNQRAGTTRDILREDIQIDGLPLRIIDTAGLRESNDEIEQEGIRRAKKEIEKADVILFMRDATEEKNLYENENQTLDAIYKELSSFDITPPETTDFIVINNKIDLNKIPASLNTNPLFTEMSLSAKSGEGFNLFVSSLKELCGYSESENNFVARSRHIEALDNARDYILQGKQQLIINQAGELLADDLRQAQHYLGLITGAVSSDDLLGEIFSSFCNGK